MEPEIEAIQKKLDDVLAQLKATKDHHGENLFSWR